MIPGQVDLDGKHSYSPIVKADDEPQIYVTDTNSTITVTGTDKCIIFLFDCEGRLISSSQTSTLAKPMSPGFYILKVHNHSGIFVKKIMIQ